MSDEQGTSGSVPAFPFPVALCDVGGTNVRFAEIAAPNAPLTVVAHASTDAFSDLADAVEAHRSAFAEPPKSLIVCAAGPVDGRHVKLTNARWTIEGPDVAKKLGLAQGLLLNDFEAQAIMVPSLGPDSTRVIGNVAAGFGDRGNQLIIGPGTGLGVGMLVPWQGRLMPLTTEAGHTDFGATTDFEVAIWAHLRASGCVRITGETLLSGPGTVRLYKAICAIEGVRPKSDDAAEVTAMARTAPEGPEARTIGAFWILTARFAGSVALGLLARGGVTLSGGILRKIADFLDVAAFREAFNSQAPLEMLVSAMPVRLVTDDGSVLNGLGALAADPGRFLIDYDNRRWVV